MQTENKSQSGHVSTNAVSAVIHCPFTSSVVPAASPYYRTKLRGLYTTAKADAEAECRWACSPYGWGYDLPGLTRLCVPAVFCVMLWIKLLRSNLCWRREESVGSCLKILHLPVCLCFHGCLWLQLLRWRVSTATATLPGRQWDEVSWWRFCSSRPWRCPFGSENRGRGEVSTFPLFCFPFTNKLVSMSTRPVRQKMVVMLQNQEVASHRGRGGGSERWRRERMRVREVQAGPECCLFLMFLLPPLAPPLCVGRPQPAVTMWPSRVTRWRLGSKLWTETNSGSWRRWSATTTPPTSECPVTRLHLAVHVHVHVHQEPL